MTNARATMNLTTYSNADWCGDKQDKKSTFGYISKFLHAPISWCVKNSQS